MAISVSVYGDTASQNICARARAWGVNKYLPSDDDDDDDDDARRAGDAVAYTKACVWPMCVCVLCVL